MYSSGTQYSLVLMVTYIAVRSQLQTYTTLSAKEPEGPHKQGSQFYLKSVLEIVIHFA